MPEGSLNVVENFKTRVVSSQKNKITCVKSAFMNLYLNASKPQVG